MIDKDCLFCKILRGEIPCAKIYETAAVLAFLDIAPIRPGHALVIPKVHAPSLWELPADIGGDLVAALQVVGRAVREATGATGINVVMNNGASAGQLVLHAHFHVIPRVEGDGLSPWQGAPYADTMAMTRMAESIRIRI
ncbi:HIT family protein [Desulfovibrio sulfodismutans]|uniref:HIT family protein n=1 Tax=Desulfolutivibrio sulfodismutans TaxID=63561 RepID=A0A7K3NMA0_9BACT|nr:HIT family protein [Desulfolutivibrio sulfodismutans]NDY56905.1 HIT family protein [Desulfolutivibrio sulfodismutans]QLA12931.1 HIT domain-containing protein [Desulfolutivibrio sulfodismutans DSM 3696]